MSATKASSASALIVTVILDCPLRTLEAQRQAIAKVAPGVGFDEVHQTALRVLAQGLIDLGALQGEIDGLIEQEAYRPYYMHGTSHWPRDSGLAPVSARRCPQPLARLTGWGTATSRNSSDPRWLSDPSEATRTARKRA